MLKTVFSKAFQGIEYMIQTDQIVYAERRATGEIVFYMKDGKIIVTNCGEDHILLI